MRRRESASTRNLHCVLLQADRLPADKCCDVIKVCYKIESRAAVENHVLLLFLLTLR